MSLINTEVKPFKANAYHNGQFIEVTEADLKGKWSVVFFYPADFTFVCPTELGDLADNYAEFQKLGVEIYAVSTDTHFTHKAWHDSSEEIKKIQYVMVGDPTWTLSKNFEVLIESAGLADRGTFVIDPEGKIQIIEINAGGIGRDAQELLRKVKAAQYVHAHPGEVCFRTPGLLDAAGICPGRLALRRLDSRRGRAFREHFCRRIGRKCRSRRPAHRLVQPLVQPRPCLMAPRALGPRLVADGMAQ